MCVLVNKNNASKHKKTDCKLGDLGRYDEISLDIGNWGSAVTGCKELYVSHGLLPSYKLLRNNLPTLVSASSKSRLYELLI